MKKCDVIVDLQYGSTGKGLIAGFLAMEREYDTVVNANMPNAGHTYIDANGIKMIHKVLPNGLVSPKCKRVMIGPGSVFDIGQLKKEIDYLLIHNIRVPEILIHPNAVVLKNHHVQGERNFGRIGSTKQGSAAAMIEKINRSTDPGHALAMNHRHIIRKHTEDCAIVVNHKGWRVAMELSNNILLEGAQGYSLGINQQFWPYCTSRECTPARFMSDCGVPLNYLREVIGVARVHPIRVGGTSGPCYEDQKELTWSDIGQVPELTTVTKKQRRVFDFSYDQMDDAVWECSPDKVFLNFVNYDPDKAQEIMDYYGKLIYWTGHGATVNDVRRAKS